MPWSLAFLPDGEMLVSEKRAGVRLLPRGGGTPRALAGGPENILSNGDSGLLDITLAPDFADTGELFISFTEGVLGANQLALYRGRYDGAALVGGEVIWRVPTPKQGSGHSGGRIVFLPDDTLLITSGEGYDYRDRAQDLRSCLGKVLRLDREGRAPADNPFAGRDDAAPEVFSYGHRNPLGLIRDPRNGAIWLHEMGPRGGDEMNLITPGSNYGWPRATWGIDYDGTIISADQQAEGVTDPVVIWNPSISPSGLALYQGDAFPDWSGDFFLGALSARHLRRVRIRDGVPLLQEILLHDRETRIRDVREGPDGFLYLLTDLEDGEVWRLRPS
jgi:aldose sugar dehydrogenase